MKAMDTLGFFLGLCYAMLAQGCEDTLTPVLVQENGIASFQYKPIATTGTDTYEVLRIDDIVRVRVIYILGTAAAAEVNTGISFTGDEGAGQISFTFTNVQKSDNGIYVLRNSRDQKLQCITLYVSGDFFNVTLSVHKNPVEEKSTVVFNCTAITTTVPSGITIAYLWTFNDKLMTGASEKTYTINNAAESNRGKYTCIALEDILGGQNGTSNEIDLEVVGTTTTTTSTTTISTTTPITTRTRTTISNTSQTPNATPVSLPVSTRTTTSEIASASSITASAETSATGSMIVALTETTTTTSARESDQALITMIIVVSVIGGTLLLAVITLIFLWVHWKKCFLRQGNHKNRFQSSDCTKCSRRGINRRHFTDGRNSVAQTENTFKDCYFYKGQIHPVCGTVISNIYPYEETFSQF